MTRCHPSYRSWTSLVGAVTCLLFDCALAAKTFVKGYYEAESDFRALGTFNNVMGLTGKDFDT